MSLHDLYQEIILDHARKPRNFGDLESSTHEAEGFNPMCGDHVRVQIVVADGVIRDLRFSGAGCAISTASASMMTQIVKGKKTEDVLKLIERVRKSMTEETGDDLGELGCLSGVKEFPNRVKCATLAWHALKSAVTTGEKVTTE